MSRSIIITIGESRVWRINLRVLRNVVWCDEEIELKKGFLDDRQMNDNDVPPRCPWTLNRTGWLETET